MSELHSKGPWSTCEQIGEYPIFSGETKIHCVAIAQIGTNANRIVACVNACEGISTEVLEKGRLSTDAFHLEESRADKAEQQRDELLAVLEFMVGEIGQPACLENRDGFAAARAALAKAKGTEWRPHAWTTAQPGHGSSNFLLSTATLLDGSPKAVAAQAEFEAATSGPTISDVQGTGVLPTPERYTSISKGGSYEKLGVIRGAGKLKGFAGIGYRDPVTGDIFIREPECFASRMQVIKADGGVE